MKLKNLITASLLSFFASMTIVLVFGFFVVPKPAQRLVLPEATSENGYLNINIPGENNSQSVAVNNSSNSSPSSTTDDTKNPSATGSGSQSNNNNNTSTSSSGGTTSSSAASGTNSGSSGGSSTTGGGSTGGGGTTTTPPPPPPPPPPGCGSAGGTCSTSQVAAHNSKTDCWQIYNGGYYIVTSYVNIHPGGTKVFNSESCGVDETGFLNGSKSTSGKSHKHKSAAYTILNSYYVGPVK